MNKINEQVIKLTHALDVLRKKEAAIYFLTMDTKGHAKASVTLTYDVVKELRNLGYNAQIMHEKKDFHDVTTWLGSDYGDIPHVSIESKTVQVHMSDLVIIPEIFGHVLEQTKEMPCEKMIFSQSYDYVLETLPPGMTWPVYGAHRALTTSTAQQKYLEALMTTVTFQQITPKIGERFVKSDKPQPPLIAVHTREPRDTMKIIKSFYLKFPQFKWITFRDLKGLTVDKFAEDLSESFVSVWVDDISGFGTFPLESMKCGVPVIGRVPNLKPDWLTEDNGIWTYDTNGIVDILGQFVQKWLEDEIPQDLYTSMDKTIKENFTEDIFKNSVSTVFGDIYNRKMKDLDIQLKKFTDIEGGNDKPELVQLEK